MKLLIIVLAFAAANAASFPKFEISGEEVLLQSSPSLRDFYAKRGIDGRAPRIVGGTEASKGQFPYVVAVILERGAFAAFCGGSVISEYAVLCAAHCVDRRRTATVSAGTNLRTGTDADRQTRTSSTLIQHEQYNSRTIENDLALIILSTPFILGSAITAVSLPADDSDQFPNQDATVAGWGRTETGGVQEKLRFTIDRILTYVECLAAWDGNYITDTMICLNGANRKGACNGDSGGPLIVGDVQVGIVSFGSSAGCDVGMPSVYTRISKFLDWISSHLALNHTFNIDL